MMDEWKEVTLGELGSVITGKTPSKKNPEDWGDNMLFITPTDFGDYGKMAYSSRRKLSNFGLERLGNKILPSKSILVTCIGSDMGKVVMNATPAITNQQINSIVPNKDVINPDFLYYSLVGLYETLRIYGGDGTAVPIVNKRDFESIITKIPPLQTQKSIATILSSLDAKIDLLHRQNKTLEGMAEVLFREWFVERAEAKMPMEDFIEINPKEVLKRGEKAPYLEMKNVQVNSASPSSWYYRDFKSGTKFRNGDAIMARLTPCLENGKKAFIQFLKDGEVGWGSTEFLIFRTKKPFHPFCAYLLAANHEFKMFAEKTMTGSSGRQRVQTASLWDYNIGQPSKEKLNELNSTFDAMSKKIGENQNQIQILENLRDTLLPKLMNGMVRVEE